MDKIFHRRIDAASCIQIAILAILAFYFFWQRTGWNVLFAVILLAFTVIAIERLMHTTYSFSRERELTIEGSKMSRKKVIPVNRIKRITQQRACFGLVRYLLVEYGEGMLLAIQPENETAFIEEFKRIRHEEI